MTPKHRSPGNSAQGRACGPGGLDAASRSHSASTSGAGGGMMRRRAAIAVSAVLTLACLALLAAACAGLPEPGPAAGLRLTVTPVTLDPDDPTRVRLGRLAYAGGLEVSSPDERFGGFSDLCLPGGGDGMYAVSDHGWWLAADLTLDGSGCLAGLTDPRMGRLGGPDGPLPPGKSHGDAEALECDRQGFRVAFERRHRIWRYPAGPDGLAAGPTPLPGPGWLGLAPANEGPEALAVLPDGRLLVLTEGLRDGPFLVGALGNGAGWRRALWPLQGRWRPTAAAWLEGEGALVLERSHLAGSWEARLSLVPQGQLPKGPPGGEPLRLTPMTLAVLSPPLTVDNMEGLAVRLEKGRIAVYLLGDDNYSPLQRTLLLKFWLLNAPPTEGAGYGPS